MTDEPPLFDDEQPGTGRAVSEASGLFASFDAAMAKASAANQAAPKPDNSKPVDKAHDPSGHRSRLRTRLLDGGDDALADHEVLEYLLITAVPRKDMKPLARSLIQRFGSLSRVLATDSRTLAGHPGMGDATAAALRIVGVAARRMARQQAQEKPVIGSWQALIDYLMIDMAHLTHERVRVLYLNAQNRIILDDNIADGDITEAAIHPRKVIHKAMDIGATALILVHNHPSGHAQPSRADIEVTNRIAEAGRLLGVTVHDHVIVGREGPVSLRAKGLI